MNKNILESVDGNIMANREELYFCDDCSKKLNEKTYLKNGGLCFDRLENED